MLRLLYTSQAIPALVQQDLLDILATAQRHNGAVGLTGVLVSGGGMFMQVLEGPEQDVLRQYGKILDDKRHDNCQLVSISTVQKQLFQNWSMAIIESPPLDFQHVYQLAEARLATPEPPNVVKTMMEFVHRLSKNAASAPS